MTAPDTMLHVGQQPRPPRPLTLQYLAIAFVAFAAALAVAHGLGTTTRESEHVDPIYVPRMDILRPALLGFTGLAADVTWLRTIQYMGGRVERRESFPQLYQLVDTTTSLDPNFIDAYTYGGLFLTIARQYAQAIQIYEKGIAANPMSWEIPYDLGRLYFLEIRDNQKALHWWEVANELPNRPHYLPRMVARLHEKVGDIEIALELWQEMLRTTTNEWVRQVAKQEIAKLEKQTGSTFREGKP